MVLVTAAIGVVSWQSYYQATKVARVESGDNGTIVTGIYLTHLALLGVAHPGPRPFRALAGVPGRTAAADAPALARNRLYPCGGVHPRLREPTSKAVKRAAISLIAPLFLDGSARAVARFFTPWQWVARPVRQPAKSRRRDTSGRTPRGRSACRPTRPCERTCEDDRSGRPSCCWVRTAACRSSFNLCRRAMYAGSCCGLGPPGFSHSGKSPAGLPFSQIGTSSGRACRLNAAAVFAFAQPSPGENDVPKGFPPGCRRLRGRGSCSRDLRRSDRRRFRGGGCHIVQRQHGRRRPTADPHRRADCSRRQRRARPAGHGLRGPRSRLATWSTRSATSGP